MKVRDIWKEGKKLTIKLYEKNTIVVCEKLKDKAQVSRKISYDGRRAVTVNDRKSKLNGFSSTILSFEVVKEHGKC